MFGRTASPPRAPQKDVVRSVDASLDEYRVNFKDGGVGHAQASREGGRLEARKTSGGGLGTPSATLPSSSSSKTSVSNSLITNTSATKEGNNNGIGLSQENLQRADESLTAVGSHGPRKTQVLDKTESARSEIASSIGNSDADKKALIQERAKLMNEVFTEVDPSYRISKQLKPPQVNHTGPGLYAGAGMKQGEIQFTGCGNHRAHYLICPKEMESTDAVLMHLFGLNNAVGWKLRPPALTVSMRGGLDHYSKWIETSYHDKEGGSDVWSGGTKEGMNEDARRMKFNRRLQEIAGGMCQAVVECGGWFDMHFGKRGGVAEIIKDGMKSYWASQSTLSGHKDHDLGVLIGIRTLKSTTFSAEIEENAVPLDTEEGTMNQDAIPSKLKSRMNYPSVDHLIYATELGKNREQKSEQSPADAELDKEAKFVVSSGFLNDALTHIIFVQNDVMLEKLKFDIANLATRAIIFANGPKALIESGEDGYILNAASRGVPVICLHHTGGAAETFGKAILQRQQGTDQADGTSGSYRLPENVPADSCLVLDSSSDSVEKVIDKLTLVLSSVQDDEMREVGNNKSEKERLLHAWTMYVKFHINASVQLKRAWIFHIILVLCNILTTVLALIYFAGGDDCEDGSSSGGFIDLPNWLSRDTIANILPLIPVVSGMMLTINSKFSPILKWSALFSNAEQIKSEIYMYRARVGDYTPRLKNNIDIMSKVKSMEESRKQAMMQRAIGSGGGQLNDLLTIKEPRERQVSKNRDGSEDQAKRKIEARRTLFANNMNAINRAVMASEVRSAHLIEPTQEEIKETLRSLYSNSSSSSNKTSSLNILGSLGDTEDPTDLDAIFDNGVAVLTAADYFQFRLQPLINEYKARSPVLSRRVGAFHLMLVFLTALTTGLSMTSYRLWVPLVVGVGAAIATTLEWEQLQNRHRNVNQCLEELGDLFTWWESLSMVEKRMPKHKEQLVFCTENNNDAEISAFVKASARHGSSRKGAEKAAFDVDSAEEEENGATL